MADSQPDTIAGRYRLDRQQGTDLPFGQLWEADDSEGGRVLLLLSRPGIDDAHAKAESAVEASRSITSPHVVAWTDGGADEDGRFWLAAPMVGEWSLGEFIERAEGLEPWDLGPIAHQISRAVAAAEGAGLNHHALCDRFVRLIPIEDEIHAVKVYGFGLAGLFPPYRPVKKKDPFLGVPDYMSPEQCQGKDAGAQADVYALGILMYQGVRGRAPFAPRTAAASASTTMKRQIFEKPLALHMRFGGLEHIRPYEQIVMRALAKQPAQRQDDCATLAGEIRDLVLDEMDGEILAEEAIPQTGSASARAARTQILHGLPAQLERIAEEYDERERAAEEAAAAETAGEEPEARRPESTMVMAGLSPEVKALADAAAAMDAKDAAETEADPSATAIDMPSVDATGETQLETKAVPEDKDAEDSAPRKGKGRRKRKRKRKVDHAAKTLLQEEALKPARRKTEPRFSGATEEKATLLETPAVGADAAPKGKRKGKGRGKGKDVRDDRGQKKTVLDFPALDAAGAKAAAEESQEEHDGWFVDAPEDLAHHGQQQKDHFAPSGKRSMFWFWAALIAFALVGALWWMQKGDNGAGAAAGARGDAAKQERTVTAAEAKAKRDLAAKRERDEQWEAQRKQEAKARKRDEMADLLKAPPTPAPAAAPPAAARPVSARIGPPKPKPAVKPAPAPAAKAPAAAADTPKPAPKPEPKPAPKAAEAKPAPKAAAPKAPPKAAEKPVVASPKAAEKKKKPAAAAPAPKPVAAKPAPKPAPKTAEAKKPAPKPTGELTASQKKQESIKHMKAGVQAYKAGNYKKAASHFSQAKKLDHTNHAAAKYIKMAREKMDK